MANPIQQGLKPGLIPPAPHGAKSAAMANPIQQGLKRKQAAAGSSGYSAAMANPIQQGLKPHNIQYTINTDSGRNG